MVKVINIFKEENQKRHLNFPDEYVNEKHYRKSLLNKHHDTYLAADKDEIAGYAICHPLESPHHDKYWLKIIYTAPAHRGRDLAKGMLEKIVVGAQDKGYKAVQSKVQKQNFGSLALHARLGFGKSPFPNDDRFFLMSRYL